MKKFLAIAAVVAVALTSCVKNEMFELNDEISFKAVNYKNTKANIYGPYTTVSYNQNEHFGVFAFPSNNPTHAYMDNVEVEYNGIDYWKNLSKTYYWPKDDAVSLSFVCYSPYNFAPCTGTVTANLTNGVSISDFTTTADVAKQVDLMATDLIANQKKDTNGGVVAVPFNHLLSQIKFTVAPKAIYDINGITIQSISFTVKSQGDYNTTVTKGWDDLKADLFYDVVSTDYNVNCTVTNAQEVGTPVMIIPQGQVDITVNYEIDYDGTYKEQCDATYTHTPAGNWEKNKVYIYNLTIGLDEILFAPEVKVWDAATELAWEVK